MMIFLTTSIFLSITTVIYSHPISILVSILLQTSIICLTLWILTKSSWFSFILFLIFLGGLMVLFVYITSLASNEMFKINYWDNSILMLTTLMLTLGLTNFTFFNEMWSNMTFSILNKILMIFSKNMILPTLTIMSYLLFVLIVAVKISSMMEGPVRNFI
uniref:NADH-ubiquinone oxidoreductase chain 6 n=1 Tax=Homidia sp. TaxID=3054010 RepID=A0AAU6PTH1_9HEXA